MPKPVNSRRDLLGFKKSYAFVIGIDHYPKINGNLQSAVNDAREVARTLKHRQGFDHVELFIEPLPEVDQQALRAGLEGIEVHFEASGQTLRDLLERIEDVNREPKIQPDECILVYYAGHGKPGEFGEGPAGYLLPADARPEKAMLKNDSLIPMEDLFSALKTLDCRHTLLILDCCFAGKFRLVGQNTRAATWVTGMPLYEERFQRYIRERAWQVLVSAGPHQTAADWMGERSESGKGGHSPFAGALIRALDGKKDSPVPGQPRGNGVLTSQELFLYLWDSVERITNEGTGAQKIQYPDLFPMGSHQGGQFIFFDPDNPLNYAHRELRNPYKGLKTFNVKDSDLFFGRKHEIRALLRKIQHTDLLVISAPSGSGKSSLVKAGLFSRLLAWENDRGETPWDEGELLVLRPGNRPWSGDPVVDPEDGASRVRNFTGLQSLLPHLNADKPQVLLLDQYEELFTEGADEAERKAFEEKLIELLGKAAADQTKIILTLRSDYEWLLEDSAFGKAFWQPDRIPQFLYRVPPIGLDDLREALVLPAYAELYEFETEQLVQIILAEIGHAPGALPMLSFTMSQFYEITNEDKRVFTLSGYQKLGGVNGALSTYADGIYTELKKRGPEYADIMHKLFLRMVKLNDGNYGRRRVYIRPGANFSGGDASGFLSEFDYADRRDAIVREVLQLLEKKQLILGGSDRVGAYYEPVHDALIQHWKTGKQWIAEFGTDNLTLQRQLWQAVVDSYRAQRNAASAAYGANTADGLGADNSLTGKFSEGWESNPKLIQVLDQLAAAASPYLLAEKDDILATALPEIAEVDRPQFIAFWEDCQTKGTLPDLNSLILSGYSDKLLTIYLEKGNHWLNRAEAEFIQQSWHKRIADVLDLKRQRDEAIAAERRSARLARANGNAFKAVQLNRTDATVALRFAEANYRLFPESEAAAAIFKQLLSDTTQLKYRHALTLDVDELISAVAWSPDGKLVGAGAHDHQVHIWNLAGEHVQTLSGHTEGVSALTWSPDGQLLLTGGNDTAWKLWDLATGTVQASVTDNYEHVRWVAFRPDGESFFVAFGHGNIKEFDRTGREVGEFGYDQNYPKDLAFSVDRERFVAGFTDQTIRVWTMAGERQQYFRAHDGPVLAVAFHPDGKRVASGSNDRSAALWDVEQGVQLFRFSDLPDSVSVTAFSPDGALLLTGLGNGNALTWHTHNGRQAHQLVSTSPLIFAAAFDPTGSWVATAHSDAMVRLWHLGGSRVDYPTFSDDYRILGFAPMGADLYLTDEQGVVYRLDETGRVAASWSATQEEGGIWKMGLSPDGTRLLLVDRAQARFWNPDGSAGKSVKVPFPPSLSLAVAPDGKTFVTADREEETPILWREDGTKQGELVGHTSGVTALTFNHDGSKLLTAGNDNTARIWRTDGVELQKLTGHTGAVEAVAFSPDGKLILTGSSDGTARLWNEEGETLVTLAGHGKYVTDAVFSPDGTWILTSGGDDTVRLWNRQGYELQTYATGETPMSVRFSMDGRYLLAQDYNGQVYKWMMPQTYLSERIAPCTLEQLRDRGLEYTPEDTDNVSP